MTHSLVETDCSCDHAAQRDRPRIDTSVLMYTSTEPLAVARFLDCIVRFCDMAR